MIRTTLICTAMAVTCNQAAATGLMDSSLEDPRVALLSEEQRNICDREQIDPAEFEWLRRSPDFDLILNEALKTCPERALLLVGPATATIRQTPDPGDRARNPTSERVGASGGREGPVGGGERSDKPKDKPKDPPKDKPKDPPKDKPKDPPKDKPKDPPKDKPKDPPKDKPKDPPKDKPKDKPTDKPKDKPKDRPKD